MKKSSKLLLAGLAVLFLLWTALPVWPYKSRPWIPRNRNSYTASLTSENVTIAVEPLFSDALAAQVFDRKDMVTRGIMPLAVIIFNDNDFPIEVDGFSVELIFQDRHLQTLNPNEAVSHLFKDDKSWLNKSIGGNSKRELNLDAVADFESKFLRNKIVVPHDKGGGFLYLEIPRWRNLVEILSKSRIYIPNVFRRDNRSRMIFFEIDLDAAMKMPH
jgi:hypothetical protein